MPAPVCHLPFFFRLILLAGLQRRASCRLQQDVASLQRNKPLPRASAGPTGAYVLGLSGPGVSGSGSHQAATAGLAGAGAAPRGAGGRSHFLPGCWPKGLRSSPHSPPTGKLTVWTLTYRRAGDGEKGHPRWKPLFRSPHFENVILSLLPFVSYGQHLRGGDCPRA